MPESLLLPKCAVEHSTNASFHLRNLRCVYDKDTEVVVTREVYLYQNKSNCYSLLLFSFSHCSFICSKLETFFQWECKAPFQLCPEKGLLSPRQNCRITVVFQPQAALVHREHAHCWFGEENNEAKRSCTVLLEGEGTVANKLNRKCRFWV